MQAGMLSDARFLQSIFTFSQNEKDFINDETVELMAPYLELEGFNPAVARNASKAAEGLCTWCRAMTYYHEASKVTRVHKKELISRSQTSSGLSGLSQFALIGRYVCPPPSSMFTTFRDQRSPFSSGLA